MNCNCSNLLNGHLSQCPYSQKKLQQNPHLEYFSILVEKEGVLYTPSVAQVEEAKNQGRKYTRTIEVNDIVYVEETENNTVLGPWLGIVKSAPQKRIVEPTVEDIKDGIISHECIDLNVDVIDSFGKSISNSNELYDLKAFEIAITSSESTLHSNIDTIIILRRNGAPINSDY